jgi:hypothetical protein
LNSKKSAKPSQAERFVEAARKAEVDESGKAFERAMKKVAKPAKKR